MSTLQEFDLLFRNFFNNESYFLPPTQNKVPYPLDIYSTKEGVCFEIACTGLDKEDVEIFIKGDTIRISYYKDKDGKEEDKDREYIQKGITKRSFDLGYRLSSKLDSTRAEAEMKNGLLKIFIPYSEEVQVKSLKIK